LHLSHEFDLAAESTYFQGGLLPSDRIEIGSPSFYAERHQSYRGTDSFVEARWIPSARFNAIAGVETVYDHERLGAPSLINRATRSPVTTDAELATESLDLFNIGSYLSVNLKAVDPWLKLTGGLRYDRHSEYGDQLSGRLGATSRWSKALVAKLLYGNAFKAPSPYTLHAIPLGPGDVIGNAALAPQHIHTVEYQLSYKPGRFFGVTSGVSYSWLFNKAEFTPQGNNQTARNVASQRSLTWETRADLRHYDDYRAYLGFDWIYSRRDLGRPGYVAELVGSRNVIYPSWIARMGAIVGVPSLPNLPLELGAEGLLVGPRRASETTLVAAGGDLVFPSYFLLDLSLASRRVYLLPGHESRFALRARNLLLARGPDPGPSGFEYPLRPGELFFEFEHVY
jgi:iron complex outermembrane receptor protein